MGGRLFADRPRRHGVRRYALHEGLPAPFGDVRRNAGGADRLAAQHRLLPAAGGDGARTYRRRGFQAVEGCDGRKTDTKTIKAYETAISGV